MKPKQKRKTLRLKIIVQYETQDRFAWISGIDEAILSKIINCKREPTDAQAKTMCKLLRTHKTKLFSKANVE